MPKDYLTSLPPKLFDYICQLVIDDRPQQYLGGISKAFLPSARERTFRSVSAETEPAATKLFEALAASPGAASHVNYLTLRLPETAFSSKAFAPTVRAAIRHLRKLGILEVSGAYELSKRLLSPTSPSTLPELFWLKICSTLKGWRSPFSPEHYRTLKHYGRLYRLDLSIQRSKIWRIGWSPRGAEPISMPSTFRQLKLGGGAVETSKADVLANAFTPSVLQLEGGRGSDAPISPRLHRLPCSVAELSLQRYSPLLEDLSAVLPNLRQVKELSLYGSFDCSTILPLLARELPYLAYLGLEANESFTAQHLVDILQGPQKILTLRFLFLAGPFARRSVHVSLEPEELIEVVELADREDVRIAGSRFWAAVREQGRREGYLAAKEELRREDARRAAASAAEW
ncbi:hypothetical protein NBRC10512_005469 [Rhodotorula toruloides]|uniref:RHTO0S22e01090g1_1 n=2 Tax=Rhodotorula toruloides TaxID=5286 RepID=A0A061BG89_RHOTO|nr:uncharacterized protein RHTO_07927 [Rhodotorula toruloides NP11]EMS18059.1 hypothetical protein RHTO_07927 [Rhodotorula toruloides NP11]CDR49005.1 RHTO0S22e01090g1_1 [Rhodotorula toruloides]